MKKKIITILCFAMLTAFSTINLHNYKNFNQFNEYFIQEDNHFASNLKNIKKAIEVEENIIVSNTGNNASELCSKLGVQVGLSVDGKKCMRFVLAIRDLNVDVYLSRKITKADNTTNEKTYKLEKAYSAIKMNGELIYPSLLNSQYAGADYKYFVTYSINAISDTKAIVAVNTLVKDTNEENPSQDVINYNIADYAGADVVPGVLKAEDGAKVELDGKEYVYKIDENGNPQIYISNLGADSGNIKITKATVTVQNSNVSSDTSVATVVLLDPDMDIPSEKVTLRLDNSMSLDEFVNQNKEVLAKFPNGTVIRNDSGLGFFFDYKVENGQVNRKFIAF